MTWGVSVHCDWCYFWAGGAGKYKKAGSSLCKPWRENSKHHSSMVSASVHAPKFLPFVTALTSLPGGLLVVRQNKPFPPQLVVLFIISIKATESKQTLTVDICLVG